MSWMRKRRRPPNPGGQRASPQPSTSDAYYNCAEFRTKRKFQVTNAGLNGFPIAPGITLMVSLKGKLSKLVSLISVWLRNG
ncbi:hypothetical protein L596_020833 [Steinernema carpocapsae]|uniref:Uncharacterized protein n=1 Tax=Steinernema carpocapsae TaxID=34508 RepID=A0A4U5MVG2_STECR|nr:hypothetical protein L596_020758 [Steinernema carpocapsae]TKR73533.1 hypothetical protein L596_020833 [Steinernema carpocapsae]